MEIGGGAGTRPGGERSSGLISGHADIMMGTSCPWSNPQRKHIVPLVVSHTDERNKLYPPRGRAHVMPQHPL